MKKLMITAAAALCATVVFGDQVESANIVGYNSKEIVAGKYYLLATQFNKTGDDVKGAIDMNDLIKLEGIEPGLYEDDFATAPVISVLTASGGYKSYYYISDATDLDDESVGYDCWADVDGYILSDANKLIMGEGFWFKSFADGGLTLAGEVKGEAAAVQAVPGGSVYYIMSNPFPVAFSLAKVTTAGLTPGLYEDDFATAPVISVLTAAGGYKSYYYISDATDLDDESVGYDCWADVDGYILEGNQVEAGASFWIKSPTAGSLGFNL